jgi:hypothetical protein
MICHNCGAIYAMAGICPRCFPTAGARLETESTGDIPGKKPPHDWLEDLERKPPIRGIVQDQDES